MVKCEDDKKGHDEEAGSAEGRDGKNGRMQKETGQDGKT